MARIRRRNGVPSLRGSGCAKSLENGSFLAFLSVMSVEQIKAEIQALETSDLQELASFLLRLRRERDPGRADEIAAKIDRPKKQWVSLEAFERRTAD